MRPRRVRKIDLPLLMCCLLISISHASQAQTNTVPTTVATTASDLVATPVSSEAQAWQLLREGKAVLLMRHALAPGVGDPANFTLGDCTTQRNLSTEGRAQAKAWNAYLIKNSITRARIFSSQWCRTLETARAINIGAVEPLVSLNSFYEGHFTEAELVPAARKFVNALEPGLPIILVSHQVNIQALSGVSPTSNQAVIVALPLSEVPRVMAKVAP